MKCIKAPVCLFIFIEAVAAADEQQAATQGHVYNDQGLRASKRRIGSVNRCFEPREESCH